MKEHLQSEVLTHPVLTSWRVQTSGRKGGTRPRRLTLFFIFTPFSCLSTFLTLPLRKSSKLPTKTVPEQGARGRQWVETDQSQRVFNMQLEWPSFQLPILLFRGKFFPSQPISGGQRYLTTCPENQVLGVKCQNPNRALSHYTCLLYTSDAADEMD